MQTIPPTGGELQAPFFPPPSIQTRQAAWLAAHPLLGPIDRQIITAILWHTGNSSGACWPGDKRLAQVAGLSPEEVAAGLRSLEGRGIIAIRPPTEVEAAQSARRVIVLEGWPVQPVQKPLPPGPPVPELTNKTAARARCAIPSRTRSICSPPADPPPPPAAAAAEVKAEAEAEPEIAPAHEAINPQIEIVRLAAIITTALPTVSKKCAREIVNNQRLEEARIRDVLHAARYYSPDRKVRVVIALLRNPEERVERHWRPPPPPRTTPIIEAQPRPVPEDTKFDPAINPAFFDSHEDWKWKKAKVKPATKDLDDYVREYRAKKAKLANPPQTKIEPEVAEMLRANGVNLTGLPVG